MDKDPARRPSAQTLMLQLVADPKTVLGFVPPPLAAVPRVPAEPQPRRMATEWDEPTTEAGPAAAAAGEPRPRSRSLAPAPAPRRRTALLAAGLLVVAAGTAGFLVASAADPGQPRRAGDTRTAVRPLPRSAAPLAADALVYQSTRGDTSSIVSIRADGTGRRQLTDGRELGELPVLTPDRRTMIYYEGRSGTLRVAAADGSASRALFSGGPAAAVRVARLTSPSLSPDGRSLVVRADGGPAGAGLYVLRVDGSAARPLGSGPDATDPAWSPDGSGIVYSSGAGPAGGAIFSIRADGSGPPRQLTAGGAAGTDSQPTFSPSLDCIAFTRGTGGPGNAEVFLMKPDGSSQRAITTVPGADTDPSWSPDGKKIAFASGRDGNREIYVMNWRGTNQTRLTRDPAADASPVWGAG
jgi:Tol biopolymer transport system component